jgi:hypothetical protein
VFGLHKWFLDCVTPDGEAVVVYAAKLHWGLLRLGYSAVLAHRGGATTARTRLGRPPVPRPGATGVALDAPRLALRGEWRGAVRSERRELWRGPRGSVTWHCVLPDADVELELAGRALHGRGYVEHLALEVAPWHLPIEELRWGRWHGGGRSLVWIQWAGPHPLRLCLLDGEPVPAQRVGDRGFVLANGAELALAEPRVLRDGELGRTVLTQRLLRLLPLPRAVRAMRETKWLARGELRGRDAAGGGRVAGVALHEVVRWG